MSAHDDDAPATLHAPVGPHWDTPVGRRVDAYMRDAGEELGDAVAAADAGCVVLAGDLERVAVLLGPAHVALVDRARAEGCRYCCCTVRLGPGLLRRLGAAASERAVAALLSAHETRGAGCPVLVCLGADVACLTVELDDAPVAAIAVDAKGGDA